MRVSGSDPVFTNSDLLGVCLDPRGGIQVGLEEDMSIRRKTSCWLTMANFLLTTTVCDGRPIHSDTAEADVGISQLAGISTS